MLQIKNLKNLGELQELFSIKKKAPDNIVDIYDRFAISRTAKSLNQYKKKRLPSSRYTANITVIAHASYFKCSCFSTIGLRIIFTGSKRCLLQAEK